PAADPAGAWRLVLPREHDHEYHVDHWAGGGAAGGAGAGASEDLFYIRTNAGGRRNFRLVTAPVADPGPDRWREGIGRRDGVTLEDVEVLARHYVVDERDEGLSRLRVISLDDGAARDIAFPEPAYEIAADHNAEFETSAYRFRYQSLVTPPSV